MPNAGKPSVRIHRIRVFNIFYLSGSKADSPLPTEKNAKSCGEYLL
jgi:hypothetical protein